MFHVIVFVKHHNVQGYCAMRPNVSVSVTGRVEPFCIFVFPVTLKLQICRRFNLTSDYLIM